MDKWSLSVFPFPCIPFNHADRLIYCISHFLKIITIQIMCFQKLVIKRIWPRLLVKKCFLKFRIGHAIYMEQGSFIRLVWVLYQLQSLLVPWSFMIFKCKFFDIFNVFLDSFQCLVFWSLEEHVYIITPSINSSHKMTVFLLVPKCTEIFLFLQSVNDGLILLTLNPTLPIVLLHPLNFALYFPKFFTNRKCYHIPNSSIFLDSR